MIVKSSTYRYVLGPIAADFLFDINMWEPLDVADVRWQFRAPIQATMSFLSQVPLFMRRGRVFVKMGVAIAPLIQS